MEHVVYTQVYLSDASDEGPLNRVWKHYFPQSPPARSTIGIARLPGTPVEMSAVAVRDLARKKTDRAARISSEFADLTSRDGRRSRVSFRLPGARYQHRPYPGGSCGAGGSLARSYAGHAESRGPGLPPHGLRESLPDRQNPDGRDE